ncbi:ABC transporter permease [Kyrpidia tusciae]|uniref:Binding-protein-dependent transport systems inner membrane component n=1 Tax=Kyrpidia tusciae (strain DSM 2912 / NBRC 15312 / T2) TaxID=562970 RepID=D5WRX5_KYRT2|nr:ABC transporter permease [Kyrpidia tusciae]ADG06927.1 binding-protein-dependent transport systems inner membrane component [Kyrpidia tusciae DSM 2912]
MSGFEQFGELEEKGWGGRRRNAAATRAVPSAAYRAYLRWQRGRIRRIRAGRWLLLLVVLGIWELAARLHWVDPMLTSMPSQIATSFWIMAGQGQIGHHTWVTVRETLIGFVLSLGVGGLAAVALWWSSLLSKVLEPYLVVLNALPKVALGPIFYIWLGDRNSIYGMAVAISIVVTILMLESGFREAGRDKLKLMESLGATRWQMFKLVVLPASIPSLVAAMKVNIGLTLVGVIMGEFLSSKAGLGFLILYGGQVFQMNLVMTSIALLVIVSVVLYGLIVVAGRLLQKRYHFE